MNVFELFEAKKKSLKNPADNPCWTGYHPVGTKQKSGRTVPNCVPNEGVAEEASPMIKPPANRFDNKQEAFAYAKEHGGKVFKSTYINPNNGMKNVCFVVKAESDVADDGRKQQFRGTGNAGMPRTDDDGNVLEQGVAEDAFQTQQLIQRHADMLGRSAAQLTQGDLDQLTQLGFSIGIGAAAGVAGVIGGYELGDRFISLINKTMRMIKKKAEVDTEEIIKLQRQIVSIHKRLKTLKSEPAIAKYQAMLKQAYEVLEELESRQGNRVAEAFQDDGKMDWDAWKQKAKQHGAVKFVDTDNKTIAYDKNSKQVSSITWSSKKKGVAEGEPIQELSSDALDRYKVKAKKSADELTSQGKYRQANDRTMNVMKATGKQIDKTVTNIRNALNRESANQGVVEADYAGADDTDTVGFYLDTERAYQAVMGRYGDMIDHDETSGIMYVPSRLWPKIEMIAFDADGIGALRDDDLENPEHYGIAEDAVMESRLQEMRAAGYDIL